MGDVLCTLSRCSLGKLWELDEENVWMLMDACCIFRTSDDSELWGIFLLKFAISDSVRASGNISVSAFAWK